MTLSTVLLFYLVPAMLLIVVIKLYAANYVISRYCEMFPPVRWIRAVLILVTLVLMAGILIGLFIEPAQSNVFTAEEFLEWCKSHPNY